MLILCTKMKNIIFHTLLIFVIVSCNVEKNSKQRCLRVRCDTVQSALVNERYSFPARVTPAEVVNISFKVSGTLENVFVDEGDFFHKGDIIAEIDARDYELQKEAVEAEYLALKADAERVKALFAESVVTVADYDKARYALRQIKAKYVNAENRLADTKLYAPFDGYVKRCLFYPPSVVGAGVPVLTLHSSSKPVIELFVPAVIYHRRNKIASFEADFDFIPEPVPLTPINFSPEANVNQLYAVRLALPRSVSGESLHGMSLMVDILLTIADTVIVRIPATALLHENKHEFVWVLSDTTVTKRLVDVKALNSDGTATVSGLNDGDIIVTAGVHSLKEGSCVEQLPQVNETNIGGLL